MKRALLRVLAAFLAVVFFSLPAGVRAEETGKKRPPNIVFVLIDTLRADHLGLYGYQRTTSPTIDEIGKNGLVFDTCYSVSNWTNPTIASLFTGRFPGSIFKEAYHKDVIRYKLPSAVPTLAETLQKAGYWTSAVVTHPGISRDLGFSRGFDNYNATWKDPVSSTATGKAKKIVKGWKFTAASNVLERTKNQLIEAKGRPFYLYVHVVWPHQPYNPPAEYLSLYGLGPKKYVKSEKDHMINAYDGEIRYTDDFIKDLRNQLKTLKLEDNTVLIITADHGEAFWEHGRWEHGRDFYNEVIHVPLIISGPESVVGAAKRFTVPVSNIDLFPTVTDIARARNPDGLDGTSLLRYVRSPNLKPSDLMFSENAHTWDIHGAAVIDNTLKFHSYPGVDYPKRLFDLEKDPEEKSFNQKGPDVDRLKEALDRHKIRNNGRRGTTESVTPGPELQEALKSLGYLQ